MLWKWWTVTWKISCSRFYEQTLIDFLLLSINFNIIKTLLCDKKFASYNRVCSSVLLKLPCWIHVSQLGSSLERVRCGTDISRNLTLACLLLKIQGETGGDVLKVERDNPVVILMIYRTWFLFKAAGRDWLPVCSISKADTAWVFLWLRRIWR